MTQDESFLKYFDGLSFEDVCRAMWSSNGSRSYLKGACVELAFKNLMLSYGWEAEKIQDSDIAHRYDFKVTNAASTFRIEVKTLMPEMRVDIGYRDYRHPVLPSGEKWQTKARAVAEDFDYLALCLANERSINDFLFISFEDLPRYDASKLVLSEQDQDWISRNYIAQSVVLKMLDADPPYFSDLRQVTRTELLPN